MVRPTLTKDGFKFLNNVVLLVAMKLFSQRRYLLIHSELFYSPEMWVLLQSLIQVLMLDQFVEQSVYCLAILLWSIINYFHISTFFCYMLKYVLIAGNFPNF